MPLGNGIMSEVQHLGERGRCVSLFKGETYIICVQNNRGGPILIFLDEALCCKFGEQIVVLGGNSGLCSCSANRCTNHCNWAAILICNRSLKTTIRVSASKGLVKSVKGLRAWMPILICNSCMRTRYLSPISSVPSSFTVFYSSASSDLRLFAQHQHQHHLPALFVRRLFCSCVLLFIFQHHYIQVLFFRVGCCTTLSVFFGFLFIWMKLFTS